MKHHVNFSALGINPTIYFHGTDEAIAEAEAKEAKRAAEVEKIIFSNGFQAMRYINGYGQQVILHHSTRQGVGYQLSFIDGDGIPAMHENYICTSADHVDEAIHDKKDMIRHFVNQTLRHDLQVEILRRD